MSENFDFTARCQQGFQPKDDLYFTSELRIRAQLEAMGIRVIIGSDLSTYRSIVKTHLPDRPISRPFQRDVSINGAAIWMAGFDENEALVHTQAVRVICTDDEAFLEFFQKNYQSFPPPTRVIDLDRSEFVPSPCLRQVMGRVCYHGELWIENTPRFRQGNAVGLTGALNFAVGVRRLKADTFVGIMTKGMADKGLPSRQGYTHTSPDCLVWREVGSDDPIRTHIVHQTRADVDFLLSRKSAFA